MVTLADIAEAVVAELNALHPAGTFNQAFVAVRSYLPEYELAEMVNLHVTVVPKGVIVESASRSTCQYDFSVDLAVQQKVAGVEPSHIDPLMALMNQIAGFFHLRRLSGCQGAVWIKTEHPHPYAQEHLRELRQFTGVLTLTFRVIQ